MKWFFTVLLITGCGAFKQSRTPLDEICYRECDREYSELFSGIYIDESEDEVRCQCFYIASDTATFERRFLELEK